MRQDQRRARRRGAVAALLAAIALGSLTGCLPGGGVDPLPPADTGPLGATGRLPDTAPAPVPAPGPAPVSPGAAMAGIPAGVLAAYRGAEASLRDAAPGCHLPWSLVAGIGEVESSHARGGAVDASGTTTSPILGSRLDGTAGNAAIGDTDGGALDGDAAWDRAVGPTQFIPSTWRTYGADGNGDGRSDPDNVHDAAVATGRYLCAGGTDVADPVGEHDAVFRYNHSEAYVATVLRWARAYASGVAPIPDAAGSPAPDVVRAEAASAPAVATASAPASVVAPSSAPRGPASSVPPAAPRPTAPSPARAAPVAPSTSATVPVPTSVCDRLAPDAVAAALGVPAQGLSVTAQRIGDGVRCTVAGAARPVLRADVVPTRSAAGERARASGPVGVVVTDPDGGVRLVGALGERTATLTAPRGDSSGLATLAGRLRRDPDRLPG